MTVRRQPSAPGLRALRGAVADVHAGSEAERAEPVWEGFVPRCSFDDCPVFDGKRCRALGCRPDSICEPAVVAVGVLATRRTP